MNTFDPLGILLFPGSLSMEHDNRGPYGYYGISLSRNDIAKGSRHVSLERHSSENTSQTTSRERTVHPIHRETDMTLELISCEYEKREDK